MEPGEKYTFDLVAGSLTQPLPVEVDFWWDVDHRLVTRTIHGTLRPSKSDDVEAENRNGAAVEP